VFIKISTAELRQAAAFLFSFLSSVLGIKTAADEDQ